MEQNKSIPKQMQASTATFDVWQRFKAKRFNGKKSHLKEWLL